MIPCPKLHFRVTLAVLVYFVFVLCSCDRKVAQQSAAERIKTEALARHSGVIAFLDKDSEKILGGKWTIEVQDKIAKNPSQLYWVEPDAVDIYRNSKGVSVFVNPYHEEGQSEWLSLHCTEQQAQMILEKHQAPHKKGASVLFIFSLTAAAPLHVELKAESTPGDEDNPSVLSVVVNGLYGRVFTGELKETIWIDAEAK